MNAQFPEPILDRPISSLPLSPAFQTVCERNHLKTLADLLPFYVAELLALPGMNHTLWNEYVIFLEKHNLGHYLDQSEPDTKKAAQ